MAATTHTALLLIVMVSVAMAVVRVESTPDGNSDVVTVLLREVEDLKGVVATQSEEMQALKGVVNMQRKEFVDLKGVVATQREDIHDLKGVVTFQREENHDLKGVVATQREELQDLKGVVATQREELQDLKGVFATQREEIHDLKGVVTNQREDIHDLKGVVATQREEIHELKGVVNRQEGDVRYLTGVNQEEQLLVQKLQGFIAEQGETLKLLEERVGNIEAFEEFKTLDRDSTVNSENGSVSYQKSSKTKHMDKPVTVLRRAVAMNKHPHSDNEGQSHHDYDERAPRDEKPVPRGISPRGIREAAGVAFCAYLSHDLTDMGLGHTVKPDQTLLNDGNGYSTHTGAFTAPVTGVYMFTFTIHEWESGGRAAVRLLIDDVEVDEAIVEPANNLQEMTGNSAIIRVNAGQTLWLQTYGWDDADLGGRSDARFVTFSGFQIY